MIRDRSTTLEVILRLGLASLGEKDIERFVVDWQCLHGHMGMGSGGMRLLLPFKVPLCI